MSFFTLRFFVFLMAVQGGIASAATIDRLVHPGAEVIEQSQVDTVRSRVVLSAVKRISNSLRIEREKWVDGSEQTWLLKLNDSEDSLVIFGYYQALIQKLGKLEFSCKERACGTSSDWANKLIGESVLTGRDSNQYYTAGAVTIAGEAGWLSAYVVKNGRQHNYVYVKFVTDDSIGQTPAESSSVVDMGIKESDNVELSELLALFAPGKSLQIGIYSSFVKGMREEAWAQQANDASALLERSLDKKVPNWRTMTKIIIGTPQSQKPSGVKEVRWFSFVSFAN